MSKKALLTVGIGFVLLLGLVALSWAAVQPRSSVTTPRAQRTVKHHPTNKADFFEIIHFNFESDSGQWIPGLPGEDPHPTTKRFCSADSSWWFGIYRLNDYQSVKRIYLDTDTCLVTANGIHLQFNHAWSIDGIYCPREEGGYYRWPPSPDDAWDIANLQISVNGEPFWPLDPDFTGWSGRAYTCTSSYAYGVEWNIGHNYGGWYGKNPSWPNCDISAI